MCLGEPTDTTKESVSEVCASVSEQVSKWEQQRFPQALLVLRSSVASLLLLLLARARSRVWRLPVMLLPLVVVVGVVVLEELPMAAVDQ